MAAATVRTPQSQRKSEKGISGFFRYLWKHKYMYLMLVPAIAFYVIFCYVPMYGATMAFKDFNPMLGIWASPWVGFEHFEQLFALDKFYSVLWNTISISVIRLIFGFPFPIIIALMLNEVRSRRLKQTIQTAIYVPNFISWVLVYSIVFMLLSSESSALNNILMGLGLVKEPVNPLTNAKHAWLIQVAIGAWKTLGYNAIIYLSAITSIDQELYQAADVDGANTWQKIVHVTVPGLLSTFFVLLLLAISNMLSNGFDQYWLLGNGMTWDKLEVFDTYVYRMGIKNMEYSLATAMGIFKSVVSIILLSFANWASKRLRGESIF